MVDPGLPCKFFNTIARSALHSRFGLERIEAAIKRFRSKSAPFTWVLGPASAHGKMEQSLKDTCPEEEWIMAAPLDETGNIPGNLPSGFDIKCVATKDQLGQFADVLSTSITPPDENIKTLLTDTKDAAIAHNSPLRMYASYVGETPTAILEAFSAHGIISFLCRGFGRQRARQGVCWRVVDQRLARSKEGRPEIGQPSNTSSGAGGLRTAGLQARRPDRDLLLIYLSAMA